MPEKPIDVNATSDYPLEVNVEWKTPKLYTGPTKYTVFAVDYTTNATKARKTGMGD